MRTLRTWAALAAVVLAGPIVAGCGNSTGTGTTSVSLKLTDAPGDLLEAWVGIDSVQLQGQSASGPGGVTLVDQPTDLVDLLTLAGTTRDLVQGVQVPSGSYAQLRIFVSRAVVVATDINGDTVAFALGGAQLPAASAYSPSRTGTLVCPSCAQSGFKVNLPGGSVQLQGTQEILVVDFDVSQSFGHDAAASSQWIMHPVMIASDFQASSTIQGRVSVSGQLGAIPECPAGTARSVQDFVPTATLSTDPNAVSSGTVGADSAYSIDFVAPGTYLMGYDRYAVFGNDTLQFNATPSIGQLSVGSGESATADYTIDGATCKQH
ncbi:MAG: DUF4382 domain-containing protein [Candidatus Palauibacterales bacterium]|nr:DUF4382 domain-containing protein [Candidatus Palauibacterales bacterium]MDP2529239.1 DUF4382 domain-containing protein [Candidatus Palauibacterales bacterium]MDP2583652.1 DUF4382 domain-containing protein [Candidatus Palauibacterales bacterium]